MTALKTEVGAQTPAVIVPFQPSANIPQTDVQRAIEAVRAAITTAIAGLMNFQGNWDASAGTFPGGGSAQKGYVYRVSVAGTVDSISFSVGDSIYAQVNNASATTYASNWQKTEGIITEAEIAAALGFTFSANAKTFNAAANYAAMIALLPAMVGDSGSGGVKGLVPAPASGDATKTLRGDGTWTSAGSGDVTAASNFGTDNRILRSDGTGKGAQASPVTMDDSGNVSGMGTLSSGAITSSGAISAGTSNPVTAGSVELGHASDTTITRTGAGAIAVEGVTVALNSTSLPHTSSTHELGHATDTTLSRSAAGRLAVEGKDALLKGQTDDLSTAGYTSTSVDQGTKSSGTFTPAYASGSVQHATNGGAHTLAPPSGHGTMILDYTNNGSAGAVTTSGFTKVVGSMATTNGLKYRLFISTGNGGSLLTIQALQ